MIKAADFKSLLKMEDVAEFYGVKISCNKALCPFHNDKNPSMTIKNGHYRCWSCGAHGDVIDFVKEMFGLSFQEAMVKLNIDFNLGIDLGAKDYDFNESQQKRAESIKAYQAQLKEKKEQKEEGLKAYHRFLARQDDSELEPIRQQVEDELDELMGV